MLWRDLSCAILPDRMQRWGTTQIHAISRAILLSPQSKSSLESVPMPAHPCLLA